MALAQAAHGQDFTKQINAPDRPSKGSADGLDAQVAAANQDWASEVLLAAKAYREDPSAINEFNLAEGYEHSGRTALAVPLYYDVSTRGANIEVQAAYDYRNAPYPGPSTRRIDSTLGGEAARRLKAIAGAPAPFDR